MFNTIFELSASFFDSIVCVLFITAFVGAKLNDVKYKAIIFTIAIFGVTVILDYYASFMSIVSTVIIMAVSIVYAILICKRQYIKALIAACVYKMVLVLLSSALFVVFSNLVTSFENLMTFADGLARYVYVLTHKVLLVASLILILSIFKKGSFYNFKTGLITFGVSMMTVLGMGATMLLIFDDNNYNEHFVRYIFLIISFLLIDVGVYVLIFQVRDLERTKYELKMLEEKEHFQEEKYSEVIAVWDNIRKVQHDIKHHLAVIKGQLEEKQYDECEEYVNSLIPNIERMGKLVRSDNAILDYLINSKLTPLKDTKTEVVVSGSVSDFSDIPDNDLVCMIGNILDNSIEAIKDLDEKRIELYFMRQNTNRMIICKNTIGQSILENNRELKTTKKEKAGHGYGHRIVEKIAKDNGGMVDYYEDNGMFCVQIMFVGIK